MAQLIPIRALRYATDNGEVSSRIAPPYDVLDEMPKQALLQRDPHNIVAVDLPVTPPKTVGPDQAYADAAALLRRWIDQGVLQRDATPCVYPYEQLYTVDGRSFRRRGLFGGIGVQPFNQPAGIWRHEHTIKAGTDDRYKLTEATAAQLSPIFGVFHDPRAHVVSLLEPYFNAEPDARGTTDNDGVEHRLWVVDDAKVIDALRSFFQSRDVFIADGHHRYTTALNYHQQHPESDAAHACLFVLVAVEDPGMIVLPTHRVVTGLTGFDFDQLEAAIGNHDKLQIRRTEHGAQALGELADALGEAGHHAMGVWDPASGATAIVTARTPDPLAELTPDKPEVWRELDVAIVHELLIDRVLRPNFGGDAIAYQYTADLDELPRMTEAQPGRLAVVMQATPLASVTAVSRAHEVMPPKSTYFYPKLATGLVVNPLHD